MINKETVRKMLENRACDGVVCSECPIYPMKLGKDGIEKWYRCCEKNEEGEEIPIYGLKFRPRVIRLLTEWLAEQEKEKGDDNLHNAIMNIGIDSISISAAISACTREVNTWAKKLQLAYEFGHRDARHAAADIVAKKEEKSND